MKAKSIKGNSPEEIKVTLHQSMTDGFKPTLAIVFLSIKQNRDSICDLLDQQHIAVFGATTNGEFIDENLGEGRILAFGPMMNLKIEGLRNIWNVPMAGMFSNGELARATGGNLEMHNLTTCCVALKER